MPRDYASLPRTDMRRDDRAIEDDTWIRQFLKTAPVGTLATVYERQPFVNSNLFVYDETEHVVYMHTANVGRTRANIEAHDRVCFTAMEMGRLLPADEALEFSVEYASVVIFGRGSVIEDQDTATAALQMLLDKYAPHLKPGQHYRPTTLDELKRTAVYRIVIEDWSAKKKEVEADFSGAYWYPEQPALASVQNRASASGRVTAIHIAPTATGPIQTVEQVKAVRGKGLEGDRYFDGAGTFSQTPGTGRDVTLIAAEAVEAVAREANLQLTAAGTRRNIVTHEVALNHLVGKTFRVGEVVLRGMRLAEPCDHLAKLHGGGKALIQALTHRGGLRAEIVSGGVIRTGDRIAVLKESDPQS
jgi:hypothetical protein